MPLADLQTEMASERFILPERHKDLIGWVKWIFLSSQGRNINVLFWMQVKGKWVVKLIVWLFGCSAPPLTAGWGEALVSANLIQFGKKNVNMQHYTLLNSNPIQPSALFVGQSISLPQIDKMCGLFLIQHFLNPKVQVFSVSKLN